MFTISAKWWSQKDYRKIRRFRDNASVKGVTISILERLFQFSMLHLPLEGWWRCLQKKLHQMVCMVKIVCLVVHIFSSSGPKVRWAILSWRVCPSSASVKSSSLKPLALRKLKLWMQVNSYQRRHQKLLKWLWSDL